MNTETSTAAPTAEQLKIRVHHVGGIGDFGPISILKIFGDDVQWTGYDASDDSLDSVQPPGSNFNLINKCIGKSNTLSKFNITRELSASSVLPCAPSAENYTWITIQGLPFVRNGKTLIWGEHTEVVKEIEIQMNSLDQLIETNEVSGIDVLSMDAQGSDYDILFGASQALSSSVIAVVTEIEFSQLYADQPLFCDIQDHLRKHDFRFCDFMSRQDFNTAKFPFELQGKGFYTVAEALFFKNVNSLLENGDENSGSGDYIAKFLKLAAVALAFDQLDFSLGIVRVLQEKHSLSLDRLAESTNMTYIKLLRDLTHAADVVEAEFPPLTYDEGRGFGTISDKPSSTQQRGKIFRYLLGRLLSKPIRLIMRNNPTVYYGPISKIFHSYGLPQVAMAHERRLVKYRLGMSYPPRRRFASKITEKLIGVCYL